MNYKVDIHFKNICKIFKNVRQICLKGFALYMWLIDFIFGNFKLTQNRQNGEHNILSSANPVHREQQGDLSDM